MRRVLDNALLSAGAAVILVLVLVALDPNVRAQISRQAATSPSAHVTEVSQQASRIAHILYAAVRDQSFANAPMLIFGAAAVVLVMFMLRT
jgi:carboxylesterase type B